MKIIRCVSLLIFCTLIIWIPFDNRTDDEKISSGLLCEGDKKAAITFDDGPDPRYTGQLLDGLKARGIRATFFVVGERADEYPELIRRIHDEGHLIGNHSYSHLQLNRIEEQAAADQIRAANDSIESITGEPVYYLRPPYGEWGHKSPCPDEMISVFWDVDPMDWKRTDVRGIADTVLNEIQPGDIVLLHDIYGTSIEAAFLIIDELTARGYCFVTVDEILFA